VDETRAAMSFPVSYKIFGNGAEQIHQLGNAVPPYMARGDRAGRSGVA